MNRMMNNSLPAHCLPFLLLAVLLLMPVNSPLRAGTPEVTQPGIPPGTPTVTQPGTPAVTQPGTQPDIFAITQPGTPGGTPAITPGGTQSATPVGGRQQDALELTRMIADKIVRETGFTYRMVPPESGGGVTGFTLDRQRATQSDTWYAMGRIEAEAAAEGDLGLSFAGNITLFLNGVPVFNGSSDSLVINEYTYDRYRFMEKVPVRWKAGTNELLVRCDPGRERTALMVLPLDEQDARPLAVSAVPVYGKLLGVYWIVNGPWPVRDQKFPPESGFSDSYSWGNEFMNWHIPQVPLLRELVIPDSATYRRDAYADWHYANGGTMLGILNLYHASGEEVYLDFVRRYAENVEENSDYFRWQYEELHALRGSFYRLFRMTMLDDSGGPALPFAELQGMDVADRDHMALLTRVTEYVLQGQERLPDGTLCRPEPEASTIWADDLFMSVPFLLRMAELTGSDSLYDEVARQIINFNRYLSDPATGLYFHGWYDRRGEHAPVRWGRANGWVVWATSEALLRMPESHPAYPVILEIFRTHMKALAGFQDPSGMWHQVLDHPETFLETSCTAMFTLGMARGARMGWLDESYKERALRGWEALREKVGPDGTVHDICRGTGIGDSVEFYENRARFDNDPRGLGAMLTAGCEIHLLNSDGIQPDAE